MIDWSPKAKVTRSVTGSTVKMEKMFRHLHKRRKGDDVDDSGKSGDVTGEASLSTNCPSSSTGISILKGC